MNFTPEQIDNWHEYERVRQSGLFNMYDPGARRMSGLNEAEYRYVMRHYVELRDAAESQGSDHA